MFPKGLSLETIYTSLSANRHENGISCHGKYMLFSRASCSILFDLHENRVIITISGHSQQVNGQRFVVEEEDKSKDATTQSTNIAHLLSTSYDKTAIISSINFETKQYRNLHVLKSPDDSFFTTRLALLKNDQFISITTTMSGSIYLWKDDVIAQEISQSYVATASQLHTVPVQNSTYTFVFIGGSDNKLHIFQVDCDNIKLIHLLDLKGHDDWIKYIEVLSLPKKRSHEFLVASASQDTFIRIWHLRIVPDDKELHDIIRTSNSSLLQTSSQQKQCIDQRLLCSIETVLSGHECIVSGLCWFRNQGDTTLKLASCSVDKTVIIWQSTIAPVENIISTSTSTKRYVLNPASSGVWEEFLKFGETSETNLPFLGICVSPSDESIVYAQSLRGAIHSWKINSDDLQIKPMCCITGHFAAATDLAWEREGRYLLSCSLDKTTRLHGQSSLDGHWHELARPQVHGHEINCISSIQFNQFVTGAEEKTIRNYEATKFFLNSFKTLTSLSLPTDLQDMIEEYPKHAQLPTLGLSIRAAEAPYEIDASGGDKPVSGNQNSTWFGSGKLAEDISRMEHLDELPTEEILIQSTLWWEKNKLFGHGNEIHALDCDSKGTFLASSSKANKADMAYILIWECKQFRKVATIHHHSLTITRLKFSPDDKYLLSTSRDRTWCLSEKTGKMKQAYMKMANSNKTNGIHERIIWDCCWTPDSKHFMTVSRDKKAVFWSIEEMKPTNNPQEQQYPSMDKAIIRYDPMVEIFNQSIQAVDCVPIIQDRPKYTFAFGLEDGTLELHELDLCERFTWLRMNIFPRFHLSIRRLSFKPILRDDSHNADKKFELILASACEDGLVKVNKLG